MRQRTDTGTRALQLPWTMLTTNRSDGVFIPASPWNPIGGHAQVRGWGEMLRSTGDLHAWPAVQVSEWIAERTGFRKRGAVTLTSTVLETEGVFEPGEPVDIRDAAGSAYIRAGWFLLSPSGQLVRGYAGGAVEFCTLGR